VPVLIFSSSVSSAGITRTLELDPNFGISGWFVAVNGGLSLYIDDLRKAGLPGSKKTHATMAAARTADASGRLEAGGYADQISPYGAIISRRRLLSIEGTPCPSTRTLFDVLLPVAPQRPSR
jgi:hypothetical protein